MGISAPNDAMPAETLRVVGCERNGVNYVLLNGLSAWCDKESYKDNVMIGEYDNVSSFSGMPFVLTSRILNDIPVHHRMGARHVHYMHMSARDWGFIAINNYIHGKLLWNVNADGEALVNTYWKRKMTY